MDRSRWAVHSIRSLAIQSHAQSRVPACHWTCTTVLYVRGVQTLYGKMYLSYSMSLLRVLYHHSPHGTASHPHPFPPFRLGGPRSFIVHFPFLHRSSPPSNQSHIRLSPANRKGGGAQRRGGSSATPPHPFLAPLLTDSQIVIQRMIVHVPKTSPKPAQLMPYPISRGPGAGACVGDGVSGRLHHQLVFWCLFCPPSNSGCRRRGNAIVRRRPSGEQGWPTMKSGCCACLCLPCCCTTRIALILMHGPAALAWRKRTM
jgi:hypothetical protein